MKWLRFLAELDLHYLVIPLLFSLLMLFGFGELWRPKHELLRAAIWAVSANGAMIALSFVGLAPWELTRPWIPVLRRCASWVAANFLVGSAIAFAIVSLRVFASMVVFQLN
jgi:hypothetical protein